MTIEDINKTIYSLGKVIAIDSVSTVIFPKLGAITSPYINTNYPAQSPSYNPACNTVVTKYFAEQGKIKQEAINLLWQELSIYFQRSCVKKAYEDEESIILLRTPVKVEYVSDPFTEEDKYVASCRLGARLVY